MSHSTVDVAYRLLQITKDKGITVTNIQLQRLVYIAHGYLLAWKAQPLIKEPVCAWRYGIVIREVSKQFSNYNGYVCNEGVHNICFNGLFSEDEETCLQGIINLYGGYTPKQIINLTSQINTPWYEVWVGRVDKKDMFPVIPNRLIQNHYRKVVSGHPVSGL